MVQWQSRESNWVENYEEASQNSYEYETEHQKTYSASKKEYRKNYASKRKSPKKYTEVPDNESYSYQPESLSLIPL